MNYSRFIEQFDQVQSVAHDVNLKNGWWDQRLAVEWACGRVGIDHHPSLAIELIGLMHTELSEAVEAARKHPFETWSDHETKDTMVRELAGTIVRIMDMAEYFKLPLAKAIEAEIEANRKRGYMHGGKKA